MTMMNFKTSNNSKISIAQYKCSSIYVHEHTHVIQNYDNEHQQNVEVTYQKPVV